jgi:hypothetical protein
VIEIAIDAEKGANHKALILTGFSETSVAAAKAVWYL